MPTYFTPGVYHERVDASPPAITALRTDIAGFVGLAERGPLDIPVPIQSWRQFQAHFGGFTGAGFLAYAVRAFFENGGRRCWVVRVASRDPNGGAKRAAVTVRTASGQVIWLIAAFSAGAWGNGLSITLKETHRAQTVSDPQLSRPEAAAVASTSGFKRGSLVRLSQEGLQSWQVVSDIDPIENRLLWVYPQPEARLPYDRPLEGFDPDRPILIESVEYTLVVWELRTPIALYDGLSLIPEHEDYGPRRLGPLVVSNAPETQDSLPLAPRPIVIEELRPLPLDELAPLEIPADNFLPLEGGADGLALLKADDFIGQPISPLDSDGQRAQKRRGLRALAEIDEVAFVAIPDIHIQPIPRPAKAPPVVCVPEPCLPLEVIPPAPPVVVSIEREQPPVFAEAEIYRVQATLVQHCEAQADRLALLEPPLAAARDDELGIGAVRAWRSRFDSKYAAFYYPWLRVVDPLDRAGGVTRDIPPCGHVAGQYAHNDLSVGVHKAPANVPLGWVQDVTVGVNDTIHGVLNPAGINVIRALPGRGIRILGTRTISSDPSWRYVNVRRLLMMIEEAIYLSTQWAVFEPNHANTRAKLRLSLTSFLAALWQQGALMGKSIEAAFFVKCDEENNPPEARGQGRLLAEVGVAPTIPFEFIILRVGRTGNEFEILESTGPVRR